MEKKEFKVLIGLWNLMFKPESTNSSTAITSNTYGDTELTMGTTTASVTRTNHLEIGLVSIDREIIQNIIDKNNKFRQFIYKKALVDLVFTHPHLINSIDGIQ